MSQLTDDTTLSEQCIQGEGMVQVNLELKSIQNTDRINIIDVLKPQLEEITIDEQMQLKNSEELTTMEDPISTHNLESESHTSVAQEIVSYQASNSSLSVEVVPTPAAAPTKIPPRAFNTNKVTGKLPTPQNENITRWVMDGNFRKEQERLKIPLGNFIC